MRAEATAERFRLDGDEDRLLRAISTSNSPGPWTSCPSRMAGRERSPSVGRFGGLEVFHIDFALQALSKIERGSPQDLDDVRAMLDRGLTDAHAIRRTFEAIRPALYCFPAVDGDRLAAQVTAALLGRA